MASTTSILLPGWASPVAPVPENVVEDLVVNGWNLAWERSQQAFAAAINYLNQLALVGNAVGNIGNVDVNLNIPTLVAPNFLGVHPTAPSVNISYTETPYSSAYLDDLCALLDTWVNGKSTGLDPLVEQAIWDRGRTREITATNLKMVEATRSFAMRGFSKPPGALSLELQDAAQTAQSNVIALSRETMIKQADLEQSNRRFALETAWKVQEGLLNYHTQLQNRILESVKVINTLIVEVYKGEVTAYATDAQAYAALANAEVTIYKGQIDGIVAEGNLRIEAAKANLQIAIEKARLLVEEMKAGASVAAQLAASAMSAVNLSGGLHASMSNSATNSSSNAGSTSVNVSDSTSHDPDKHYSDNTNHNLSA
jgi:hypothetical protein